MTPRGRLLGPDAVEAAVEGFRRLGAEVVVRPSPWRLGPTESNLAVGWLTGWVDAACEQEPALVDRGQGHPVACHFAEAQDVV
jgi:hypothetical protein